MRTICVTTLSVMLLTAFCDGAFGSNHCRPTGELQEKAQALANISVDGCADVRVSQALPAGCRLVKFFPAEAAGEMKMIKNLLGAFRFTGQAR